MAAEWVGFPGGELEGRRPEAVCAACRARDSHPGGGTGGAASGRGSSRAPLCFQCYRAGLDRAWSRPQPSALAADASRGAGGDRWQWLLPFEPVNRARLEMLRAERATSRLSMQAGTGRFVDRRRRAQIAARHALRQIAAGLHRSSMAAAVHSAELQFPDAWLPFVVSR